MSSVTFVCRYISLTYLSRHMKKRKVNKAKKVLRWSDGFGWTVDDPLAIINARVRFHKFGGTSRIRLVRGNEVS